MKKANNTKRHIPSRWITYHFVCRECGKSDVGKFDKFTDPKNSYLLCQECKDAADDFYDELSNDLYDFYM